MISDKRLAEITKLRNDAALGYAVVKNSEYSRDVKELLDDRDELLRQVKELVVEEGESVGWTVRLSS